MGSGDEGGRDAQLRCAVGGVEVELLALPDVEDDGYRSARQRTAPVIDLGATPIPDRLDVVAERGTRPNTGGTGGHPSDDSSARYWWVLPPQLGLAGFAGHAQALTSVVLPLPPPPNTP